MASPFMKALESRLANPSFQRGITEAGLSILANSGPSAQPRSLGQNLAQGAMQGMGAYRQESEHQAALAQQEEQQRRQEEQRAAALEASEMIEDPALRRLASVDPEMAQAVLMKRYEREITPYQQANLDQGSRRLDVSEEQAAADQALAERKFGLQEQGLDLQRQKMAQASANQPLVEIVDDNGQVRYVQRNQAVGMEVPKKSPMVSVNTGEQSAFSKEKGKRQAERYAEIVEKASNARERGNKVKSLLSLNESALSGFGADARLEAARAGNFVGIGDGETVAATESMQAGLSDLVLQKQIEQKGPQTESDARRLEKTVGNLATSREAREALLSAAQAEADYTSAYGDRVDQLVNEDLPLTEATKQARTELGDAPDLLKVYEDLAKGGTPEAEAEAPQFTPDRIPDLEARGAALEQQYIANGMSQEEAEKLVASELQKEFGL